MSIALPGDLLAEKDALLIRNWRVNTQGGLKSRVGMALQSACADPITSICRVNGATIRRYHGAAGVLYDNGVASTTATAFGAPPISMVSYQGQLWATTQNARGRHDGAYWTSWGIAGPVAAPTASAIAPSGAGLTGDYTYYVTFYDQTTGYESPPSPGITITLAAQAAHLTIPLYTDPAGFDAGAVNAGRNIYRAGGNQKDTVRVRQLSNNAATTADDEMSEVDAEELGILLQAANNDAPPAAAGVAGPYFERLLMFCSADHPNRIWWSKTLQPFAFPGADADAGNWVDIGELGEAVLAVAIWPRMAVVYKQCSIWRIVGDPGSATAEIDRVATIGIVGSQAIASVGTADYFESLDGVYWFNGETPAKISAGLDPLFWGEYPDTGPSNLVPPQNVVHRANTVMAHRRGRIFLSYTQDGQTVNSASLVYEIGSGKWVDDSRGFTALYDEGQVGELLAGGAGGLEALENGLTDNGVNISLDYYGHFDDQASPENQKVYADLVLDCNCQGANVTARAYFDNGQSSSALGFFSNAARGQIVLPYGADLKGLRGYNHAIRLTSTLAGSVGPVIIYKATIHYYVLPRTAKTFDSQITDLGMREVKLCDFIELDIEVFDVSGGTGSITWALDSDRPTPQPGMGLTNAPSMAQRATGTFGIQLGGGGNTVTGRRQVRLPVTECQGELFRLTLTADGNTTFLLHSARCRVRPIGVYLDGANGESFASKEIGIGV